MFIIIYGVLGDDDDGSLSIDGPFFYRSEPDFNEAEILARELASTKSKNQYIPWVFELKEGETIPEALMGVRDGWFQKFKQRTMETYNTIQKDQVNSTCPFNDISIKSFLAYNLK
jgi:hypothetical protein